MPHARRAADKGAEKRKKGIFKKTGRTVDKSKALAVGLTASGNRIRGLGRDQDQSPGPRRGRGMGLSRLLSCGSPRPPR